MKSCPTCQLSYTDDTLEFCLEDGTRLQSAPAAAIGGSNFQPEIPTVTIPHKAAAPTVEETVAFPFSSVGAGNPQRAAVQNVLNSPLSASAGNHENKIAPSAVAGNKILELAPVVIALAHNWWQWVYLNEQYYTSFSAYVLSANFLMWLLLLAAGATVGLLSIKRSENRAFAVTSLVILAINLLLYLVPKR